MNFKAKKLLEQVLTEAHKVSSASTDLQRDLSIIALEDALAKYEHFLSSSGYSTPPGSNTVSNGPYNQIQGAYYSNKDLPRVKK